MWQDVLVTLVAAGAVALLGRRWLRSRSSATGSCPSCASGAACGVSTPAERGGASGQRAVPTRPLVLVRKEEMGRERFGPGGNYRF
jgi:positive regulator of sigma E activity